jgi:probable FeS assembly SUF system protein SufT
MINSTSSEEVITFSRECKATMIPSGTIGKIIEGEHGIITQSLGGSYTVAVNGNLYRIEGEDADAIGKEQIVEKEKESHNDRDVDERAIWDAMRTCYDPEIPVNIVDLGLIYSCDFSLIDGDGTLVDVAMTLTAPGCGMGPILQQEVEQKLLGIPGVSEVKVVLVWDPPWSQGMMSEAARLQLGLL